MSTAEQTVRVLHNSDAAFHACSVDDAVAEIRQTIEDELIVAEEFIGDGQVLTRQGKVLPPRPEDVSTRATFDNRQGYWIECERAVDDYALTGLVRYYHRTGGFAHEHDFVAGEHRTTRFRDDSGQVYQAHERVDGAEVRRMSYRNGDLCGEWFYEKGKEVRGWQRDEAGRLTYQNDQNGKFSRKYHASGTLAYEQEYGVAKMWREEGTLLATEEPGRKGTRLRTEFWPDETVRVSGHIHDDGWGSGYRPVGNWKVFGAGGKERGTVDMSQLESGPQTDVATTAEALLAWQALRAPDWLQVTDNVDWLSLEPFFGDAKYTPQHVVGLAVGDAEIVRLASRELSNSVLHQGSLSDTAESLVPYLASVVRHARALNAQAAAELLCELALGGDSVGSRVVDGRAWAPVADAVATLADCLRQRVVSKDDGLRKGAQSLLVLAGDRIEHDWVAATWTQTANVDERADLLLWLGLARVSKLPDVGDDPLLALCHNLTTARVCKTDTTRDVVAALVRALPPKPDLAERYKSLSAGGVLPYDIYDVFATMRPKQRRCIVALLLDVPTPELLAQRVEAALSTEFPNGFDANKLNANKRALMSALADTMRAGVGEALRDMLASWGVPSTPDAIMRLVQPAKKGQHHQTQ